MIIVFLIDTSVSMNQRLPAQGVSLLDVAKCGVEHFIKARREKVDGRNDKYWLATTDAGATALKVGPREAQSNLSSILKCLAGHSYTRLGPSLKTVFEVLNQARLLHPDPFGVDRYGMGWHPCRMEPAVVILFTDGTLPNYEKGVVDSLIIPTLNRAESELTEQPFRWDQRLFSFEIRPPPATMDAFSTMDMLNPRSGLKEQCQATGGHAHVALSLKHLQGLLEQLAAKVTASVVVNLTLEIPKSMEDGELAEKLYQKPVAMARTNPDRASHWPIPEDYHVDATLTKLPPRRPHPHITLRRSRDFDGVVPPYLVHDVYTLESAPFTDTLVKKFKVEVWKAYIWRRETNAVEEESFGFVKVDPATNTAKLVVLPPNYPELLSLLSKVADTGMAVTKNARWRKEFEAYVRSIPMYYVGPLREAMKDKRLQLQDLVPKDVDTEPCQTLKENFKTLKARAKTECETWQAERTALLRASPPITGAGPMSPAPLSGRTSRPDGLPAVPDPPAPGKSDPASNSSGSFLCWNPFEIERSSLLVQLERMKVAAYAMALTPTPPGGERPRSGEASPRAGGHLESPRALPARMPHVGSRSTISSITSTESLDREIDDAVRRRVRFQRLLRQQQQEFSVGQEERARHGRPVGAMGDYMGPLARKQAGPTRDLRDVFAEGDEPESLVVYFGSRYKDKKKKKRPPPTGNVLTRFNIDEAEVSDEVLQTVQRVQQRSGSTEKPAKRPKESADSESAGAAACNVQSSSNGVDAPSGEGMIKRASSAQPHSDGAAGRVAEPRDRQRARSPSPSAAEDRPRQDRLPLSGHPVLRTAPVGCVEALAAHREWLQFLRTNHAARGRLRRILSSDSGRLDGRHFMDLVRGLQGSRAACVKFLAGLLRQLQERHPKRGRQLAADLSAHLSGLRAAAEKPP